MNQESFTEDRGPKSEQSIESMQDELQKLKAQLDMEKTKLVDFAARSSEFYNEDMVEVYENALVKDQGDVNEFTRLVELSKYSYPAVIENHSAYLHFTDKYKKMRKEVLDKEREFLARRNYLEDKIKAESFQKQKNGLYEEAFDLLSQIENTLPKEAVQAGLSQDAAVNLYFSYFGVEFYKDVARLMREIGELNDSFEYNKYEKLAKLKSNFEKLNNSDFAKNLELLLKKSD